MPCFNFYVVTHSYSSRPFLCALAAPYVFSPVSLLKSLIGAWLSQDEAFSNYADIIV